MTMRNRIFSVDNPKSAKAQQFRWLNAIHYMAPHRLAGVGNMCPKASEGCKALCLGEHSGHAAIIAAGKRTNSVRQSRREKARRFMRSRDKYMRDVVRAVELLVQRARRENTPLCVRMNGSTDIGWHGVGVQRQGKQFRNLFEAFPETQFVDYTKVAMRFARQLPANYHLTFSRSETNETECLELLGAGHNVAVVFTGVKPATWHGYRVIDGDQHDLRQLDPKGVVIGLSPKGRRAKRDKSGFVVR